MPEDKLVGRVANIPLARPGFDALGMSAPTMVQINPTGKWETTPPDSLDAAQLKKIVDYLTKTKAIDAAQSYCCQCCAENQKSSGGNPNNFVPIIMMPILPADLCPFDMDCEIQKKKESEEKAPKDKKVEAVDSDREKENAKQKKRCFVMQRLTDFDLLSQW